MTFELTTGEFWVFRCMTFQIVVLAWLKVLQNIHVQTDGFPNRRLACECLAYVTATIQSAQTTAAMTTTEAALTTTTLNQQTSTTDSDSTTLTDEATTVTGLQTPTGISRPSYIIHIIHSAMFKIL